MAEGLRGESGVVKLYLFAPCIAHDMLARMDRNFVVDSLGNIHFVKNSVHLERIQDFFYPNILMASFFVLPLQSGNSSFDSYLLSSLVDLRFSGLANSGKRIGKTLAYRLRFMFSDSLSDWRHNGAKIIR